MSKIMIKDLKSFEAWATSLFGDEMQAWGKRYSLSTEGYYFEYRPDNNDRDIMRATLYNSMGERVDDVRVSDGYGMPQKTHHQVINYFEARLTLDELKTGNNDKA